MRPEMKPTMRVCVTGAAGQIAYSLLLPIARGDVFGADQPVDLALLDIAPMLPALDGVKMELQDCSLPLLTNVLCTDKPDDAFKDAEAVFLVGAMPRRQGMERKDLLAANVKIFKVQGQSLDTVAKKTCKVLVVGNPANTNCFITRHYAPSLPDENFSALTRLDHNRAVAQVADKLSIPTCAVCCVTIWGNHSNTQFPDLSACEVTLPQADGSRKKMAALEALKDDDWVKNTFVPTVQQRGAAVIAARKQSSAMSAAKAICDHMRDWFRGTDTKCSSVSMAVVSDGSYEIDKGLVYSFPVHVVDGRWQIVKDLKIDDYARTMMTKTLEELREERDVALALCQAE